MTTDPRHHEPLDAEERDLAARLGRIGPFDGPSPALDAKILAAAHAASVAKPRSSRRRWLAWVGVPPALVTGVGVAAAAVLALGLVWQMRPRETLLSASESAAGDEEVFVLAPPMTSKRPPVINPPPFPQEKPATAQTAAAPAAAAPAPSPPPPAVEQPRRDIAREQVKEAPAVAAAEMAVADAVTADQCAGLLDDSGDGYASRAYQRAEERDAAASADQPADKALAGAAMNSAAASGAIARRERAGAPAAPPAPEAFSEAKADTATRMAKTRQLDCRRLAAAGADLDAVTVTGSRIALPNLPPRQDTRLGRDAWLQRIHERRDSGDIRGAKESLRLFRRWYPHARIPPELAGLLAPQQ